MKETSGSVTVEHNLQSRLAIKITGIVFWGLVVTGLTLAIILLQDVEEKKTEYIDALTDRFAFQIQQEIYYPDHTPLTRLKNRIDTIREQSGLQAVAMELEGETLKSGEVHDNMIENIRYVLYEKKDKSDTHLSAKITVYFPNPKLAVAEERKHLLMTMGVLFILFGFGLQKVLQYVLTAPFMRMVKTAQAISSGDNTKRFEEDRQDEFGFLSKFINKSLDFLTKQKDELTCTLEELRKSEVDLYQEKERAEVTLHSIGDAVITTDADGIIEYLNPAAEVLTGWESIELRGKQIKEVIKIYDESTQALLGCPIIECLLNEEVVEPGTDSVLLNREGNKIAISDSAAPIRDHSGKVIGAILVFQDVTETRKLTKQLAHNASHDPLTELFNRREFEIRLQQALVSAHENDMQHAICYLDLDQFKIVNDTCGHAAGDALLRQLPALLEEVIDEGDVLARLGGDEMGVLLNN
ncbi:MAG: diguanylate cyclase, partial [Gammaproteobacteria bacterium]|nr:diguanylate cyclase [Gammaproteobacteria bacterium]